jgi:hypothetical protein
VNDTSKSGTLPLERALCGAGCRPRRFTRPTIHWWHGRTLGDVESGLFLGGIPCTRAGSGPRKAVMFFGANALFKRPAISWHGEPWGEERL